MRIWSVASQIKTLDIDRNCVQTKINPLKVNKA